MPLWIDLDEIKPLTLHDLVQMIAAEFDAGVVLQIAIAVLSFAAIAMVASTGPWHRWGFVVGLISQPLWLIATWRARQWGMLILSVFYLGVWIQGIANRF